MTTWPMLIVEDEPLMRDRIAAILRALGHAKDSLVVTENVARAKLVSQGKKFSLALVDLGLPDGNGIDLIRWLRADDDALPILVVSAWNTEELILAALRAGASGYVLKEREDVEIGLCIRSVMQGGAPIDPFIAKRILGFLDAPKKNDRAAVESSLRNESRPQLSERETDILKLVAKGMTNREIGRLTELSDRTVESHISHIYRKLCVHSRTEAVFEAQQHGLLR